MKVINIYFDQHSLYIVEYEDVTCECCKCLIDRIKSRVNNWKNKLLSYAGRLQWIATILASMHINWASVFSLPKTVIKDICKVLRGYLWCNGEISKGKIKVAWKNVCKPKKGCKDSTEWMTIDGCGVKYSVHRAWLDWRIKEDNVSWKKVVWFSHCTPKHSFIFWHVRGYMVECQPLMPSLVSLFLLSEDVAAWKDLGDSGLGNIGSLVHLELKGNRILLTFPVMPPVRVSELEEWASPNSGRMFASLEM
nr:RNA-directed DNA polymerase, eukaryota, reverse transcriptase zinc-binding domain protein [Tanacetum cinerariifolium]